MGPTAGLYFFFVDERDLLSLQGFEPLTHYAGRILTIIASGTWSYHWTLNCSCFFLELRTLVCLEQKRSQSAWTPWTVLLDHEPTTQQRN